MKWLSDANDSNKSCSLVGGVVFGKIQRFKYKFQVYKLDFKLQRWIEVKTLGNNVFFLSSRSSLSLPTPHCQGDHIYFADDANGNFTTYDRNGVQFMGLQYGLMGQLNHVFQVLAS